MPRAARAALLAIAALGLLGCEVGPPAEAPRVDTTQRAYGEPSGGFPNWYERVVHMLTNRARADIATDLAPCVAGCSGPGNCCGEASCFPASRPPMQWKLALARVARFHCANLSHTSCGLQHDSPCTLVANIDSLYPGSCDGEVACACQGNQSCSGGTSIWDRFGLFGVTNGVRGENAAMGYNDPWTVFYAWLHEPDSNTACTATWTNGHRWNILDFNYGFDRIGVGYQGSYAVQDFQGVGSLNQKIPAGAHYPQTANNSSVAFRANWYDTAGPAAAVVNVDGTCYTMNLERGVTQANATFLRSRTLDSSCHRYYFVFLDSNGVKHYYPDTGAYGVNCANQYTATAPPEGTGCICTPSCAGLQCGGDGCGGSCGTCTPPESCQAGQCVCVPSCAGKQCGGDGCGGSCGTCTPPESCQAGQCVCNADCAGKQCGGDGCGGSCGACTPPESCQAGQCVCNADCSGAVCGPDGCGGTCGSCGVNQVCQAGQCVSDCAAGLTLCGADCVDLQTDAAHCAGCGSPCAANEACVAGVCTCQPDCGAAVCGDDGCGGSCGACASQELCVDGQCVCQPDCGAAVCGDDGCGGSCGACPGAQVCQDGQCAADCSAGFTLCGQDCVDTDTSAAHCGGCDQPCGAGEQCEAGGCVPVGAPDGGVVPDGGSLDAGIGGDGSQDGTPVVTVRGGCYCATARPAPGSLALLWLVLLGLLRRSWRQGRAPR